MQHTVCHFFLCTRLSVSFWGNIWAKILNTIIENNSFVVNELHINHILSCGFPQGDEDLLTVNIGEIFLEFVNMLPAFQTYCLQQPTSVNLLNALEKEKELLRYWFYFLLVCAEMAKVHTSFTQVEVQILVFKNTLVKVLTKLLYSSKSKEGFEMYFSKKYP